MTPSPAASIGTRVATNSLMLLPYVVVLSNPQQASPWWAVPMLFWGNWAFRQFANANRLGSITVPVKPWQFLTVNLLGSALFAGFGIVVIPILILADVYRLVSKS